MKEDLAKIAERYRSFANDQVEGSSPSLEAWARGVADHEETLARIAQLPYVKQQPNLLFAAARWHGLQSGDVPALIRGVKNDWCQLREIIMTRTTQTNEPARCAALLFGLAKIPGPIALVEVGAAAGLCLCGDRYSYRFSDGTTLDPADGVSSVVIDVEVSGHVPSSLSMPDIVWRAGLDLNPLDPADPDTQRWLSTLIWPEHHTRKSRLAGAAQIAAGHPVAIAEGDLLKDLPRVAAQAPAGTSLVVVHSATLVYLGNEQRTEAVKTIRGTGARWLSFEGRTVAPGVDDVTIAVNPDTLFVAALDGRPYAVANGHGDHLTLLDQQQQ